MNKTEKTLQKTASEMITVTTEKTTTREKTRVINPIKNVQKIRTLRNQINLRSNLRKELRNNESTILRNLRNLRNQLKPIEITNIQSEKLNHTTQKSDSSFLAIWQRKTQHNAQEEKQLHIAEDQ